MPGGEGQAAEGEGWPASLANFPLGQWIADNRRFHARGRLDQDRIERLEKLGMVWSHFDVAWEEGSRRRAGGQPSQPQTPLTQKERNFR
ncbi:helicase associated domain-containing protein [Streptomyces albogriseolus]|uniref:helicase associated domain-containing protein n=1 Tax=Streptomyces albogriseolus TaxID=1887 RepID=UPI003824F2DB